MAVLRSHQAESPVRGNPPPRTRQCSAIAGPGDHATAILRHGRVLGGHCRVPGRWRVDGGELPRGPGRVAGSRSFPGVIEAVAQLCPAAGQREGPVIAPVAKSLSAPSPARCWGSCRDGLPRRRAVDGAMAPAPARRWACARAGRAAAGAGVSGGAGGDQAGRAKGFVTAVRRMNGIGLTESREKSPDSLDNTLKAP